MKKLAFLIDEIDNSKELIRFAALLGKDINAKVHVLHIQKPEAYGAYGHMGAMIPPAPELIQDVSEEVKVKVREFIKEIVAELSGIPSIDFKSEMGHASAILKEKVESNVYDMVMLQGHTEQGFLLQNSNVMGIVRNLFCPVWIIPPDTKYQPLEKIIYATDYNEEDITTLKNLVDLAKPFDPEILALHISNDDKFEKKLKSEGFAEMLSEKTNYKKVSVKMIADKEEEDAVKNLVNEAKKEKANLIVVLKENRNFFERLFKNSFTAELIKDIQLPVLVFHKKEK